MAHVRYNKILTHSYSTPGLSCHFSVFGLFFLFFSSFFLGGGGGGGRGLSLFWELRDNGVVKNFQFRPY